LDFDPRDRDDDPRDVDAQWVDLRSVGLERDAAHPRDLGDRDRDREGRDRDFDPRDVFADGLELPRGLDREVVLDGEERYELNGDDSRTVAAVGAFRVVAERDLQSRRDDGGDARDPDLRHLRSQGLIESVKLHGRDRAVTLTERGHRLLENHRREDRSERGQAFDAGVSRPRELAHDAQLYRAYLREAERLRDKGADIHRVVLDQELKREYQEWLQERNRGRADSDGRPDRHTGEIEAWAREHDLPYFDDHVHFPDFRIEYELHGREQHEDVEVVTEHYRGAHAASVARAGFRCYGRGGGGGGPSIDPRLAEDFV
jgi:DNA-binding PadR family transcriptional regulator